MAALIEAINIKRKILFEFEKRSVCLSRFRHYYSYRSRRTDFGAAEDEEPSDERGL
jgi:hypothetical protein